MDVSQHRLRVMVQANMEESRSMADELLLLRDVLAHYPTECLIGAMARSTQGSCACGNRLCVEAIRCRALQEADDAT